MSADVVTQHVRAELRVEEGYRERVYDDATGHEFVRGMTLKGNLTVATGVNLSAGLDQEECEWLTGHRLQKCASALSQFSWYATQDDVRKVAILDIAFNLGLDKFMHWKFFIHFMDVHDYVHAESELTSNHIWNQEVGARALRLTAMVATGAWPADVVT